MFSIVNINNIVEHEESIQILTEEHQNSNLQLSLTDVRNSWLGWFYRTEQKIEEAYLWNRWIRDSLFSIYLQSPTIAYVLRKWQPSFFFQNYVFLIY